MKIYRSSELHAELYPTHKQKNNKKSPPTPYILIVDMPTGINSPPKYIVNLFGRSLTNHNDLPFGGYVILKQFDDWYCVKENRIIL